MTLLLCALDQANRTPPPYIEHMTEILPLQSTAANIAGTTFSKLIIHCVVSLCAGFRHQNIRLVGDLLQLRQNVDSREVTVVGWSLVGLTKQRF